MTMETSRNMPDLFSGQSDENIVLNDASGTLVLHRGFDRQFDPLHPSVLSTFELRQERILLFGKEVKQPRLSSLFGDHGVTYRYSQRTFTAHPWNEFLLGLNDRLAQLNLRMNSALVNYYRNGQDAMGWHADNEPELGVRPTIVSVSYGSTRRMQFRKNDGSQKVTIDLHHGDLLIMSGSMQHEWKHALPRQQRIENPRLNFTFRQIETRKD